MRIRIALIAAMSVAFTMLFMMLFSSYTGVAEATTAPHFTDTHRTHTPHLVAFDQRTTVGTDAAGQTHRTGSAFPSAVLSAELPAHTAFAAAVLPSFTPPAPPPPPVPITDATSTDTADWACIRVRESGDEYNNPAEPSGAYGILLVTWESNGYSGWPYEASAATQNALALKLYNEYGWQPWSSRFACGL